MNGSFERFNFRAKAVLCVLPDGRDACCCRLRRSLRSLARRRFADSIDARSAFGEGPGGDFCSPTPPRWLSIRRPASSGSFSPMEPGNRFPERSNMKTARPRSVGLRVADGSKSVTITFGATIRKSPTSPRRRDWAGNDRPQPPNRRTPPRQHTESYMAANADLIKYAQQLDSGGVVPTDIGQPVDDGSGTVQTVKTNTAPTPLAAVLGAMIFIPSASATIIFILEVVVAMNFLGLPDSSQPV